MLPKDFPPRSTVFGYFRRWRQDGTLLCLYYGLLFLAREAAGRGERDAFTSRPPASSTASRSKPPKAAARVGKPALGPAKPDPGDAGKKVNGRKRHVLVDTLGLLLRAIVHPASIQDRDGLAALLIRIRGRFPWLDLLFADGGYQGDIAAAAARHERLALAIVKRSDQAAGFVVLPRRRVVERTFAWLNRNRRLAKDVEALIASSTAHLYLAATRLLTRRLVTP